MQRWLCPIFLLAALPLHAQAGIPRWDALPAVDAMHLQGPYAGRSVCPMCQHGYDAGLLVFLPSTTSPADATRMARELQTVTAQINDSRFRSFLLLTGAAPSPALLSAVKGVQPHWYVAHLSSVELPRASRDFNLALDSRAQGYVFAQRRRLLAFDPDRADSGPTSDLMRHSRYAMTFLQAMHAQAPAASDADAPQGRMWTAPARLASSIALSPRPNLTATRVCFADRTDSAMPDALVAMSIAAPPSSQRAWWARTDGLGCVSLQGAPAAATLEAEVFVPLQATATATIDARDLRSGDTLQVRVESSADVEPTGHEAVVGLPCEGCEAVFEGMPTPLSSTTRLTSESEPGESLMLSGTLKNSLGAAVPNVIVYAYQTDRDGAYPDNPNLSGAAARHGRLRGWARTDASGKYTFHTIRPGAYPGRSTPQHIHLHLIEPGRCTYYIGDVLFDDDPRLSAALRAQAREARGGNGIVQPQGNSLSGWRATREITLGLNVPGYRECATEVADR